MARSYRGVGTIRWGAQDGKDGVNYLIMGWWSANVHYKLTDAGIPVVKVEDTSPDKFSVYKLTALQSTLGTFIASEWEKVKSADFVYMQDAYIEHLQAIMVTAKTLRTDSEGARTEIDTEGIKVFNAMNNMNIRFGLKEGYAVMQYFDNNGILLYDLGPNGITHIGVREEKWQEVTLYYVAADFTNALLDKEVYKDIENHTPITCYRYLSRMAAGIIQDEENNNRLFENPSLSSYYILDGAYTDKREEARDVNYYFYLQYAHEDNEPVVDTRLIYSKRLYQYIDGVLTDEIYAFWNKQQ